MTANKILLCGTVFPGCEFVMHGEKEADVLAKLAEHARTAHGVEHLSDALRAKILASVRVEESRSRSLSP